MNELIFPCPEVVRPIVPSVLLHSKVAPEGELVKDCKGTIASAQNVWDRGTVTVGVEYTVNNASNDIAEQIPVFVSVTLHLYLFPSNPVILLILSSFLSASVYTPPFVSAVKAPPPTLTCHS